MTFHKVKKFGSSLHVCLSKQDYEVGDNVEIVKIGSMLKSKEMELWIRDIIRAEIEGRQLNIDYNQEKVQEMETQEEIEEERERKRLVPELDEDL